MLFSYRPDENTSISSYRSYSHPHPCVRLANAFDVLANYICSSYSIERQIICDVMSKALSMLITIGQSIGIHEFEVLQTSLGEINNEIVRLKKNIGDAWIEKSNKIMVETIINIRKKLPLV